MILQIVSTIFLVSVPETILNIYGIFLITGGRELLPFRDSITDRKTNIKNMFIAVSILVIITNITLKISPHGMNWLINIPSYIMVFKYVYRQTWLKAIVQTLLIFITLLIIESIFISVLLRSLNLTISDFYLPSYYHLFLLSSFVGNAIQLFIVISMWNWQVVIINLKKYKLNKRNYIFVFLLAIFIESVNAYRYLNTFSSISFFDNLLSLSTIIASFIFNLHFTKLYVKIIREVRKIERVKRNGKK